MAENKKTPLQEAICEIDRLALNKADTKEGLHMLALIKNYIKGTLLPKEKEFAKDMWKKGKGDLMFHENKKSFEETYQQYEP